MYQLVVADDENIECMTLEYIAQQFLSSEVELLGSVQDGISLLKLVEERKPDIAIVDINMPGLSGLDAIEILRLKHSNIKIIIHTAYSEFAYAQRAIQLGAVDYLVKPNLKEEIIASIRKTCSLLDREKELVQYGEQSNLYEKHLRALFGEKWMMSLFLGQPDEDSFEKLAQYEKDVVNGGVFTIWKTADPLTKNFEEIVDTLKANLEKYCTNICFQKGIDLYCLLFPGDSYAREDYENWVQKLICLVKGKAQWGKELIIGVSSWLDEEYSRGIPECEAAIFHRNQPGLYFNKKHKNSLLTEKFTVWKELAQLFREEKDQEAMDVLEESLRRVDEAQTAQGYSAERRFQCGRIYGAYLLLRMEEELETILGRELEKNFSFWKTYEQVKDFRELINWGRSQYQKLRADNDLSLIRKNPYLNAAYHFVYDHYQIDIPLERCAEEAGISPFYLSRLLKSEMKVTFVEMLTDIRMRKAFLLLYETEKPIQEIGLLTGYQNQSYLYKVFKKTTGLSLGDIRQFSKSLI